MTQHPVTHVNDALSLTADARLDFFILTPSIGTGTIYFRPDNDVTWRGNTYLGLPLSFTGEKDSAEGGGSSPRLQIGSPNIDLSIFKSHIRDGSLDNAVVVRKTALLTDVLADNNIYSSKTYRVETVENYSRSSISLLLARFSGARRTTIPFRQFLPPDFPFVSLS